jgi:hypothetical protein
VSINNDVNHYVYILIYTISVESQPTMKMNIYNQCSGFKLKYGKDFKPGWPQAPITYEKRNGGYFSDGADWNQGPYWEVKAGDVMSADLIPILPTFGGVLTYQLQRENIEFDDQLESTHIRLFVAWKSESYKKFHVLVQLIECDKTLLWDEIKLKEYYQRNIRQLCAYTGPIKNTWLIPDGTVLMTRLELDFMQRDDVLNITIAEGVKDDYTKPPEWVNPNR